MSQERSPRGAESISRRDMLRRSAVVGGALAVAAPAVQSFGRPAFAFTKGSDFSVLLVAFYKPGVCTVYLAKFTDNSDKGIPSEWEGGGPQPCTGTAPTAPSGVTVTNAGGTQLAALPDPQALPSSGGYTVSVGGDYVFAWAITHQGGSCCPSTVNGATATFLVSGNDCVSGNAASWTWPDPDDGCNSKATADLKMLDSDPEAEAEPEPMTVEPSAEEGSESAPAPGPESGSPDPAATIEDQSLEPELLLDDQEP